MPSPINPERYSFDHLGISSGKKPRSTGDWGKLEAQHMKLPETGKGEKEGKEKIKWQTVRKNIIEAFKKGDIPAFFPGFNEINAQILLHIFQQRGLK